jgi:FtsH-binding integral membrane protein
LTFVLISTIVFLIFFFFRHSAIIYIIGSLCLSFGSMSSRLFLRKFLSEHLSFELSMCMMFGILGICTIIFYFIFINKLSILFLGIGLVIFALRIAYKEIKKDKLNIDFNRNP